MSANIPKNSAQKARKKARRQAANTARKRSLTVTNGLLATGTCCLIVASMLIMYSKTKALTFGMPGGLFLCALGAGCVSATLAASVPLALLSRWYAVKARAPATVFLLCGIFPLVPGAGIYYTAYYFVSGQMALFSAKLAEVIKVALALSVGIAVVLSVPLPHSHVYGPKGEVEKAAPFSHFRH